MARVCFHARHTYREEESLTRIPWEGVLGGIRELDTDVPTATSPRSQVTAATNFSTERYSCARESATAAAAAKLKSESENSFSSPY